jgi:hypothetical protein
VKSDFSWSGAVLAGFGVLRREPGLLLLWGLVGVVFGLADQVIGVNAEIFRSSDRAPMWLVPMLTVLRGVIVAVAMAIFSAAAYRAVLQPDGETRGRMRFGSDEIRLTLVWLLQGLLLVALTIVTVIPSFALSMMMAKQDPMITGIVGTVVAVGTLIAWIVLLLRLSLAAPMALAEGRWSIPAAWRLSRGHAWKIAGVYFLLIIGWVAIFGAWDTLYGLGAAALHLEFSADRVKVGHSLADVFRPVQLIFTVASEGLSAAAAAVLFAPAAFIYRALKGDEPDDQAAVFD